MTPPPIVIHSGGQSGVDQAAWRAAHRYAIPTAGWMPRGFLTEDGPRPEFAEFYGAREHTSAQYRERTKANVADTLVTVWFGSLRSTGFAATNRAAHDLGKTIILMGIEPKLRSEARPGALITVLSPYWWRLAPGVPCAINIAGNRESKSPGIGVWVEEYLCEVFLALGFEERTT